MTSPFSSDVATTPKARAGASRLGVDSRFVIKTVGVSNSLFQINVEIYRAYNCNFEVL